VVANAREVLDATAADEHDRVLLKVVAFTADVTGYLESVDETDAANLAKGRFCGAAPRAGTLVFSARVRRGARIS
jgi:hypothetical protein